MPSLRLLYCDSAGVRRCRVVVHKDPFPTAAVPADNAAAANAAAANALANEPDDAATPPGAAAGQPRPGWQLYAAGVPSPNTKVGLEQTPSMVLAAAAGAIPAPTGGVTLSRVNSLVTVHEDPTSPQAGFSEPPAAQQQAAPGSPEPAFRPPSLRPSPSMLLAAAAGAIAVPSGAESLLQGAESGAVLEQQPSHPISQLQHQQQQEALATASGPSFSSSSNTLVLEPTPSIALAAAAGAIPALPSPGRPPWRASPSPLGAGTVEPVPLTQLKPSMPHIQNGSSSSMCSHRPSAFLMMGQAAAAAAAAGAAGAASSMAVEYSVGLTKAAMAHPVFADIVSEGSGCAPVGEVLLVPDLAAAQPVPWQARGISMAPVDMMEKDMSRPWSCCPRSALKRALSLLQCQHGITVMAGFELEFVLLKPAPTAVLSALPAAATTTTVLLSGGQAWVPVDASVYDQTSSLDSHTELLEDIIAALQAIDIGVIQYHAESGHGQYEVALKPFPALAAADKLMFAREAVTAVVSKHGLAVTFLPKPLADQAGSGCHMHLSLWRGGVNIMAAASTDDAATAAADVPDSNYALSSTADRFLAGILSHLPALLPFTAPSVNSYERLKPCCWSGAFSCWGYDNREAPLRVCCPRGGPQSTNAEFKAFDGSTNPYIGLAAVLAAGLLGLQEGAKLPSPLQVDPGSAAHGHVAQQLPTSLHAALQAYEDDAKLQAMMQQVLGSDLVTAFMAVRRCEKEANPSISSLLLRY